jgi:hypothetical protein
MVNKQLRKEEKRRKRDKNEWNVFAIN